LRIVGSAGNTRRWSCGRHSKQSGRSTDTWHNLPITFVSFAGGPSEGWILYPLHDRSLQDGVLPSTLVVNFTTTEFPTILPSFTATDNHHLQLTFSWYIHNIPLLSYNNIINTHPVNYKNCILLAYAFFPLLSSSPSENYPKGPPIPPLGFHFPVVLDQRTFYLHRTGWYGR